ncbi:MAG: YndJ family protein [Chloroflexota bacterium]|nr:YndJ family protein [Chloroflexota bacterium]
MVRIATNPSAWTRLSAVAGGTIWLGLLAMSPGDREQPWVIRAIQFAILVVIPFTLALIAPVERAGRSYDLYRMSIWLQPVAGSLAALSFWRPSGAGAAALAVPWFACTVVVALYGGARLLRTRPGAAELCLCAGMALLPVGSGWLLLHRAGLAPGGYSPTLVLLIALHYHYAGFAAPILTGLAGQRLAALPLNRPIRHAYRAVAAGVCVGSPLVAIGTTAAPLIEVCAVLVLASSLVGLALLVLACIVPRLRPLLGRALLTVSSSAVLVSMLLAVVYAISNGIGRPLLSVGQMERVHGTANAMGFVLCGLLAWSVLPPSLPSLATEE